MDGAPLYEVAEFPTKDDWLDARRGLITGTDAAAILGLHAHRTAFEVWAEKTGNAPKSEASWRMRRGLAIESELAQVFSERTKKKLAKPWSAPFGIVISRETPWLAHTPDNFVYPDTSDPLPEAGWEGKSTRGTLRYRWQDFEIPDEHYMQNTIGLIVTGLPRWFVTVEIGDDDPKDYETPAPAPEFRAAILEQLDGFWQKHVRGGIAPDVDGSAAARHYLQKRFPTTIGSYIGVGGEMEDRVFRYRQLLAIEKEAAAEKELIKNQLLDVVGEHDGIEGEWGRIHMKWRDGNVSWKDVAHRLHSHLVDAVGQRMEILPLTTIANDHRGERHRHFDPKFRKEA